MLELTAPRVRASTRSRHKQLEITEEVVLQSNTIIEQEIQNRGHLIRDELIESLSQAGISVKDNRGYHLLLRAELDGLICSGELREGKHSYALVEERVSRSTSLPEEEAVARLAMSYFRSHGPATLKDFIWWSGLTSKVAKAGLSQIQEQLASENIAGEEYWFSDQKEPVVGEIHFLPAYDEFVIGYKDKTFSLLDEAFRRRVQLGGVFRPMVVVNGLVSGIWKWTVKGGKGFIQTEMFEEKGEELLQENLPSQTANIQRFFGF